MTVLAKIQIMKILFQKRHIQIYTIKNKFLKEVQTYKTQSIILTTTTAIKTKITIKILKITLKNLHLPPLLPK